MTQYLKLKPDQPGWQKAAVEAIKAGKPVEIYADSDTLFSVIKMVHERAEENPFADVVEKVAAMGNVPEPISGLIGKVFPLVGTVAAMGGGPAGALLSMAAVVGYATLHGFEIDTGWAWHKLFNPKDDEAYVRLTPPAKS